MKKRTKILIGLFLFIIIITIAYSIIFCIKGDYPKEMYMALIPTCITEFFILYKLKINEDKK